MDIWQDMKQFKANRKGPMQIGDLVLLNQDKYNNDYTQAKEWVKDTYIYAEVDEYARMEIVRIDYNLRDGNLVPFLKLKAPNGRVSNFWLDSRFFNKI